MGKLERKTVSVLALMGMLFVFTVASFPLAMAVSSDNNSTVSSSGSSAAVTPVAESVNSVTAVVNPSTSKVKPLEVAATRPDSATSPSTTLPWAYILMTVGFTVTILVSLALKRRGHKSSRVRHLISIVFLGLLIMSTGYVYGEENRTVSIWDLTSAGIVNPMIISESVDSNGNVWFSSVSSNRIGCLNPSTNEIKIVITPEAGGSISTISVDHTDKVWFVDTALKRVGRFDTATNFFTIWPVSGIPYWGTVWSGIGLPLVSSDSHGNAYFPEYTTNKIGRIDPVTNELTEWAIPTSDSEPCFSMVDANDNAWFAECSGNKIGRLNPLTNEITEWAIPTSNSGPSGLYVAQGLIYFAEYIGQKIGRLNPSRNEMTQWSLSWYAQYPRGLSVDSSGNAWFVTYGTYGYGVGTLFRLGTDNIFTYWQFPEGRNSAYGATVDARVNLGDVYVATWYDLWGRSSPAVLRFHQTP